MRAKKKFSLAQKYGVEQENRNVRELCSLCCSKVVWCLEQDNLTVFRSKALRMKRLSVQNLQ